MQSRQAQYKLALLLLTRGLTM